MTRRLELSDDEKPTYRARLASRVKPGPNGCIEWTGAASDGRAKMPLRGHSITAARIVWLVERGPIEPKQHVCHRCDNKLCVNVEHLFIGTARDNARDKENKKRGNHRRGLAHPFHGKRSDGYGNFL